MLPADLLVVLCAHGAKHGWKEPALVRDIARLVEISAGEIDWPDLLNRAAQAGALRMLLLGLRLAADTGAPVPENLLSQAEKDRTIRRLVSRIDPQAPESPHFFIQTRERLRDRLACRASLALTPNEEDYALLPLPTALSPLYYPLHALRVAGKYSLSFLRRR